MHMTCLAKQACHSWKALDSPSHADRYGGTGQMPDAANKGSGKREGVCGMCLLGVAGGADTVRVECSDAKIRMLPLMIVRA